MNLEIPFDAVIGMITGTTIVGIIAVICITIVKVAKIKSNSKCGCK